MNDEARLPPTSRAFAWVLGIAATIASAAIVASFGLLFSMSHRLTVIETTIENNREERQSQVGELRLTDQDHARRLGQLERDVSAEVGRRDRQR